MSKIQEITGSACYLEEWMKTVKEIAEGFKVGFLSIGIRRVEEHVRVIAGFLLLLSDFSMVYVYNFMEVQVNLDNYAVTLYVQ